MAQSWKEVLNGSLSGAFSIAPEAALAWKPVEYVSARRQLTLRPEPMVLWVGRLVESKDSLSVFTAFAHVVRKRSAVLFMAYHDSTMESLVRKAIQSLGISDRVRLLGRVEHDRLRLLLLRHYSWADCFLHASWHEGGGAAVLEAAMSGLLLCGTRTGFLADLEGTAAVVSECGDWKQLSHAVLMTLRDPKRVLELTHHARSWAAEDDEAWTARKVADVYDRLVKPPSGSRPTS